MLETAPVIYDLNDKPHTRSRFSWVKRLVQGQNRNTVAGMRTPPQHHNLKQNQPRKNASVRRYDSDEESSMHSDNVSTTPLKLLISHTSTTNPPSLISGEAAHESVSGVASTAETSIAPSVHVSLTPSTHGHSRTERDRERDRDSESIVTLASSSRRTRRRSLDDNCSMAGIAPASIMERLLVHAAAPPPETEAD